MSKMRLSLGARERGKGKKMKQKAALQFFPSLHLHPIAVAAVWGAGAGVRHWREKRMSVEVEQGRSLWRGWEKLCRSERRRGGWWRKRSLMGMLSNEMEKRWRRGRWDSSRPLLSSFFHLPSSPKSYGTGEQEQFKQPKQASNLTAATAFRGK